MLLSVISASLCRPLHLCGFFDCLISCLISTVSSQYLVIMCLSSVGVTVLAVVYDLLKWGYVVSHYKYVLL